MALKGVLERFARSCKIWDNVMVIARLFLLTVCCSSTQVTGTFDPSASQSALSGNTVPLCVHPRFAPPVKFDLELTAAAQGIIQHCKLLVTLRGIL